MASIVTTAIVSKPSGHLNGTSRKYEIIHNFECPAVGEDDVVIKVAACAVSDANIKILDSLKLSIDGHLPVGRAISGTITQVGKSVTKFKVNDDVTGIIPLDVRSAGCAQFCVIPQHDIVLKPGNVKHVDAAAVVKDAVKAYTALHYLAKVSSGDTILIFDGASGFGLAIIQLAQSIGAKVIATVSSEEELLFLRDQQPPLAQVIDMRLKKRSLVNMCIEETGGLGVDCVIDNGAELYTHSVEDANDDLINFDENLLVKPHKHDIISSLAVGGRWITTQSNLQLDPPDCQLLFLKCASVHFLFEDAWTISRGAQGKYLHILQDIMDKLSKQVLRPTVHHCVQLQNCPEALKNLDEIKVGKVVANME
eukprot:Seg599.3 transcript_id=Seg599.3/GoldUCD/mRNA.D3Y31 product="Quinone oxidoreductase-like protein 1" protein_id=Seg599.3/GoldUCD/D3Y31